MWSANNLTGRSIGEWSIVSYTFSDSALFEYPISRSTIAAMTGLGFINVADYNLVNAAIILGAVNYTDPRENWTASIQ